MDVNIILNHLEALINYSFKMKVFVTIPEELHGVNLKPVYDEIRSQGLDIELGPDGSFSFKVVEGVSCVE